MKKIILLGLLTIFACSEKDNTLSKEEIFLNKINSATSANLSVDELPNWLQAKVNDIKKSETPLIEAKLLQCDWNKQSVYHIWCNLYSCLLCETYSSDGEKIVFDSEQKSEDFINKSENWQLLWTNIEDEDTPRYIICEKTEGNYIDTINLQGNGYMFLNSIPAELENNNDVAFVLYFPEQDSAIFRVTYPDAIYNADICNFPDYAKHWEIPLQGKAFSFEGDFYEEGRYLSVPAHSGGKLVLTVFKSK